jgi:hypothetical protein
VSEFPVDAICTGCDGPCTQPKEHGPWTRPAAQEKEKCKGYMCSNDAAPTPTGGFDGFCVSCQAHDEV